MMTLRSFVLDNCLAMAMAFLQFVFFVATCTTLGQLSPPHGTTFPIPKRCKSIPGDLLITCPVQSERTPLYHKARLSWNVRGRNDWHAKCKWWRINQVTLTRRLRLRLTSPGRGLPSSMRDMSLDKLELVNEQGWVIPSTGNAQVSVLRTFYMKIVLKIG